MIDRVARFAIASFACLLLCAAALAAGDKDKDKDKDAKKWDVAKPPGEAVEVEIDTTETTWSNVDVSPDGKTVVFDMLGDIYAVPAAGGDARALTRGMAWDFEPRFSPDGQRIAFVSDRGGADNLWVMRADGSDPRAVTEETEHLVHNPAWSPDGEYIAAHKDFTSTRSIPAGEIWLFHRGGGGGLQLVERPNKDKDQKTIGEPAFSPDGRYVYFSQDTTPGTVWQYNKDSTGEIFSIKRFDRERGEVEVFVSGPGGAVRPTPSPDGKQLAFVRRTPGMTSAIFVKDLASGREWPVFDRLDRDLQETNGSEGNSPSLAFTPDSRAIVFWAGGRIRRVEVATKAVAETALRVRAKVEVRPALRFPVDVAPDEFDVRMPRFAQMSPDGKRAVFEALGRIWVTDLPDGKPRRLTAQEEQLELWPQVSRDGREIVYVTWNDRDLGSVRVAPAAGGAGRKLTPDPGHYVEPSFSPDGRSVVYRKLTGGYITSGEWSMEPGLWVVPVAGGPPQRVSKTGFDAHFAAAGDRVLFSAIVEDTKLALKSVDLAGRDERTHLEGANVTEFRVSPDGRWVAFTERWNAWVAPFTATGRKVEIGPDAKSVPVRQVSKRSGEFLHWSADSSRLHWSHGATLYTRELKDAFAFLDGAPAELPPPVEKGIALGFRVTADKPAGSIALVGGRVVTMRDAGRAQEVLEDGVVVVRGNRIAAVGRAAEVEIPRDAQRVDVAGKTVLPGIVDVHAHGPFAVEQIIPQQNWQQLANLAFGVTTIHDPSNDTSSVFAAAELQRAGKLLAPRIFSTGTILYGAHAPQYTASVESYDDALFHVRRLHDVGAISVKSYQMPRRDQRQEIVAAGRELGVMVVPEGGAKFQHNLTEIVDGHTGIEHALPLARVYADVEQLWSATAVGYTPTFVVAYGGISGENYWYDRTDVWTDAHLMRFTPRFAVEPRAMRRTKAPDAHYNHIEVAKQAKRLRDRGVSVQLGAHGQLAGLAAHWEIWSMAQGGFSPWEALRGATIDGARYIGLDRDVGSIEKGKLADLFVVDGNPLQDLRVSERVAYTMLNGRLYDATSMDQVAPDKVHRDELFFEREGGDTIHPATEEWLDDLRQRFGWAH